MLDSALSGDVASTGDGAGARRTRQSGERRASASPRMDRSFAATTKGFVPEACNRNSVAPIFDFG